jgi:hypothetical protein
MWISHLPDGSGLSGYSSVLSGAVLAEEIDSVGDKWSGDITTIYVRCLLWTCPSDLPVLLMKLLSGPKY